MLPLDTSYTHMHTQTQELYARLNHPLTRHPRVCVLAPGFRHCGRSLVVNLKHAEYLQFLNSLTSKVISKDIQTKKILESVRVPWIS